MTRNKNFWNRVNKPSGEDACWEWTGGRFVRDGYGKIRLNGKDMKAHRVSYELASGSDIPSDMVVRHKCDNPPCVRPDHLELGTPADNRRDCVSRNRQTKGDGHWTRKYPELVRRGETHPHAKLSQEQVEYIVTSGKKTSLLAQCCNVSVTRINQLKRQHKQTL